MPPGEMPASLVEEVEEGQDVDLARRDGVFGLVVARHQGNRLVAAYRAGSAEEHLLPQLDGRLVAIVLEQLHTDALGQPATSGVLQHAVVLVVVQPGDGVRDADFRVAHQGDVEWQWPGGEAGTHVVLVQLHAPHIGLTGPNPAAGVVDHATHR